jgi:hypothetical protein
LSVATIWVSLNFEFRMTAPERATHRAERSLLSRRNSQSADAASNGHDDTIVAVWFTPNGVDKSVVAVTYTKLTNKAEGDRMKQCWAERLDAPGESLSHAPRGRRRALTHCAQPRHLRRSAA